MAERPLLASCSSVYPNLLFPYLLFFCFSILGLRKKSCLAKHRNVLGSVDSRGEQ